MKRMRRPEMTGYVKDVETDENEHKKKRKSSKK